ncbi:MAG: endo alpha-1,4 polygalactosaminidase [Anaerolineales bacterium]|nr:endo alpha-1,4 polygalactosaminidase [Anaerolineales bacterium]
MRLPKLSRYACYYGTGRLPALTAYDLVILQALHYTPAEIAWLRQRRVIPIAYLALGEEPSSTPPAIWSLVDAQTGRVAYNPTWQTTLVDCRFPAWHAHLLQARIPEIVARGFPGLFLDTLDVQEQYPDTRPGVVKLVAAIHAHYPDLILIANRGFSILGEIESLLDAFLFEAFTTQYAAGAYVAWQGADLRWTAQQAAYLQTISGQRPVLALDYAAPQDHDLRRLALARAQAHGFLSSVTTWSIDWLPEG